MIYFEIQIKRQNVSLIFNVINNGKKFYSIRPRSDTTVDCMDVNVDFSREMISRTRASSFRVVVVDSRPISGLEMPFDEA